MNRLMHICAVAVAVAVLSAMGGSGGPVVPLPPLAKVADVDASGKSWRQSGEISGSVAKVHGDFSAAMAGGGWVLKKTISLGRTPNRRELKVRKKGQDQILLMIREKHAGLCSFSWGLE